MFPVFKLTLAASVVALGLAAPQAGAAVTLLDIDWDSTTPDSQFAYNFKSGGSGSTSSGVTATGGAGGTAAYSSNTDSSSFAQGAGTYWGAANVIENEAPADVLGGVLAAGDIAYSFDLALNGRKPTSTSTSIRAQVRFTDALTSSILWEARFAPAPVYNVTDGLFQTMSGTLDGATTVGSNGGSLAAALASPNGIKVRFSAEVNSGHGAFGFDTDNIITFDNIQLTVPDPVPEPASLGLLGAGALAVLRRRR